MTQDYVKPPYSSYNRYFLIPFLLWVVIGGIVQLIYSRQTLFALFNTHHTAWSDILMFYITKMGEGMFGVIIMLLLLAFRPFRNWWYFSAAVLCNLLPALLTQWIKSAVNAPRPLTYFHEAEWIHTVPEWPRLMQRSFPSGHTCSAFALFCFLAFILTPRYKWAAIPFFIFALLVGYSRMYLAAHFFIDVYVGSIIGVAFTILVLSVMRHRPHYFFRKPRVTE